ncbi:hypothetical protein V6N13_131882 [Hibiscus sabdariffa]|uniref:Transmembrane protein n=1 Tax=Hibiscus sabdariffa TaxID=183260 RepID=A0ABR2D980_9ROSI
MMTSKLEDDIELLLVAVNGGWLIVPMSYAMGVVMKTRNSRVSRRHSIISRSNSDSLQCLPLICGKNHIYCGNQATRANSFNIATNSFMFPSPSLPPPLMHVFCH